MKKEASVYTPILIATVLLWATVAIAFPHYQYYLDPDSTSYLTIARRYASGNYAKAINGLWSPWACWLTALLMKLGLSPVPAAVIINTAGANGFLVMTGLLLKRFGATIKQQWLYLLPFALFLCFAVYWQLFDDLWQCFFLLIILRLYLHKDFTTKPSLWLSAGIVAAFALFAKAYSLPFFVLTTTVAAFLFTGRNIWKTILITGTSTTVCIIAALPWIYALHSKYGMWTASTAGGLNLSWYLVGHPVWKDWVRILLPPAYPDSVYFWEDPYPFNGKIFHFWDSSKLAIRQVLKIGYNTLIMIRCMAEISLLLPPAAIFIAYTLLRKWRTLTTDMKVLMCCFLLLPSGYIMVHFESRYLWYMLPIAILVAISFFRQQRSLHIAFAISLLLFPAWQMVKLFDNGKPEYEFANRLKAAGFSDINFVSNLHPRHLSKIAYFSGNHFFVVAPQSVDGITASDAVRQYNSETLFADCKKFKVAYYLFSPRHQNELENPGYSQLFFPVTDNRNAAHLRLVYTDNVNGDLLYKIDN